MRKNGCYVVAAVLLMMFGLVVVRLAYISLFQGPALAAQAEQQHSRSFDYYQYARGDIYDRNGRSITGVRESCLVIFPAMVENDSTVIEQLAKILDQDESVVEKKINTGINSGTSPFIFKTGLNSAQREAIENAAFPGILVFNMAARYSANQTAAHIIGYVLATAADGSYQGVNGLEQQYDAYLRDRIDQQVIAYVDVNGELSNSQFYLYKPQSSKENVLHTTIDIDFQQIAEQALADYEGACVILDVANGDILASVSAPSYDQYLWQSPATDDAYVNKAFSLYPPASTFKLLLAMASLEEGITPVNRIDNENNSDIDGESLDAGNESENTEEMDEAEKDDYLAVNGTNEAVFICNGYTELANGSRINCWLHSGHGPTDLSSAIRNSCNVYFVELGLALGGDTIKSYAERLGLTEQYIGGYELPAQKQLDFLSSVQGDVANVSIGENGVRLSPLQVAQLIAVCANGGYRVFPRLVDSISDENGNILLKIERHSPISVVSQKTADTLRNILIETVQNGTASAASSACLAVGGKTGTAEDAGVWFAGFAPADQPQWAISVYVENGVSGGKEAAAVFTDIVDGIANLTGLAR